MGAQVDESPKKNKKVSKAEEEAERYLGKVVLILSETQPMELSLIANMLYLKPAKLRYWLVKKRLWDDCITVEKRNRKWWASLSGPERAWLAAVYEVDEPKPIQGIKKGNELFKRMVEIGERGNVALFTHKLEDGRILLFNFDGKTKKFFACIPLRPIDILVNGEYEYRVDNPEARGLFTKALELLGFHGELRIDEEGKLHLEFVGWGWVFKTVVVVKIGRELLDRALREGVVEVIGEHQE